MIPYQQSSHNMRGEASGSTVSSYILDVSSLSLADDELNVCFVYCDDCHSLTRTVSDSGNEYLGGVAACEVCGALREIGRASSRDSLRSPVQRIIALERSWQIYVG
jgi:hypothetical protein